MTLPFIMTRQASIDKLLHYQPQQQPDFPAMSELDDIPAPCGQLTLKLIANRQDTNLHGDIPGGWLVGHMDQAAELTAGREAHGRTATVAIESMDFLCPVRVGSMVNIFTEVREIGHSSLKIDVEVWSRSPQERDPDELHKVTEARFVMVALDDNGRIRAVHQGSSQ